MLLPPDAVPVRLMLLHSRLVLLPRQRPNFLLLLPRERRDPSETELLVLALLLTAATMPHLLPE